MYGSHFRDGQAATGLPAEIAGDLCAKAQAVSELRGEKSLRLMCILFFYGLRIDYKVTRRATHSVPLPRKNDPFGSLCVVERGRLRLNTIESIVYGVLNIFHTNIFRYDVTSTANIEKDSDAPVIHKHLFHENIY